MLSNKSLIFATAALAFFSASHSAQASTVYSFAAFTSDTLTTSVAPGTASGAINTPAGIVNVTYTGDLVASTQINNAGTNYYSGYSSVYTNSTVSNLPTQSDILTLDESQIFGSNTLTFSQSIVNPILDIVSLGGSGAVTYNFNAPFTILSQGSAYYGGCSTCLSQSGNSLSGTEGSGVIQFIGNYSSLSFTTTGGEYWNGFNVGVAGIAPTSTPEPATYATLFTAMLLGIPVLRRRARKP